MFLLLSVIFLIPSSINYNYFGLIGSFSSFDLQSGAESMPNGRSLIYSQNVSLFLLLSSNPPFKFDLVFSKFEWLSIDSLM
jgi:hypothetical protein